MAWLADLLTNLEVDTAKMRKNLAVLAESGVTGATAAGLESQLAGAGELVDRALAEVER